MWPVLSNVCERYQRDVRVMERCCRCIRFAVRCIGKHSAHLLEPIVKQVLIFYRIIMLLLYFLLFNAKRLYFHTDRTVIYGTST